MDCPHCAERLGLVSLVRRRCSTCGLSLAAANAPSSELRSAVAASPLRLRWLLLGAVVTAGASVVPSLGVLQLLVVAPIQLLCIERAVGDYAHHLPPRALFAFELGSSLLFLVLAAVGGVAGFMLEVAAGFVAVPAFVAAFFGSRALVLALARRTAEGKGPGWLADSMMGLLGLLVLAPPIILLVTTLRLSGDLEAHSWNAKLMLQLASMASLSVLDLVLMPAWLVAVLAFIGNAKVAPDFAWAGSWWFLLLMTLLVLGEAFVDNAFDRRRRFSRTVWPAIQSLLAPATLFFLICALGQDLSWPGRLGALLMGVVGGWQLRKATNRAKSAMGFFPGVALAGRRAQLGMIPLRLGGALGGVLLARWKPLLTSVGVAGAVVVALVFMFLAWTARRALRSESRVACSACGTSVKRRARVCSSCRLPLALTLVRAQPPHVRTTMSAAALFAGVSPQALEQNELFATERPDEAALRARLSELDRAAARDVLAVVSAFPGVAMEELAKLARLVAKRRSRARALLEAL